MTGGVVSVTMLRSSNESVQIFTRGVFACSSESLNVTNSNVLLYLWFIRFSHGTGMHHVTKSADVKKKKKKKKEAASSKAAFSCDAWLTLRYAICV